MCNSDIYIGVHVLQLVLIGGVRIWYPNVDSVSLSMHILLLATIEIAMKFHNKQSSVDIKQLRNQKYIVLSSTNYAKTTIKPLLIKQVHQTMLVFQVHYNVASSTLRLSGIPPHNVSGDRQILLLSLCEIMHAVQTIF